MFQAQRPRSNRGFTMTELMIVIVLAGILFAFAIPSFLTSLTNSALNGESNRLLGALIVARSEAITRGVSVTVCRSADQATCGGADWNNGWIVFADANGNGTRQVATEDLLRVDGPLENNLKLEINGDDLSHVRYLPSGNARSNAGSLQNKTLLLCRINRPPFLTDDDYYARSIILDITGRAGVNRGLKSGDSCPNS